MRLTADQIKQGLLHADQEVRVAVVYHFAHSFTADESILPLVIEAIDRYSVNEAFPYYSFLEYLPLSDDTLPWLLRELSNSEEEKEEDEDDINSYHECLISCLVAASPSLLQRHKEEILELTCLSDEDLDAIDERIWFPTRAPEELWDDLLEFCEANSDDEYCTEAEVRYVFRLVAAIAQHRDELAERVLQRLAARTDDQVDSWLEPLLVRLAGEMRLEEAVPQIIDRLGCDDDFLREECERALIRIGSDAVVDALAADFATGDESIQRSVCFILERLLSDRSVTSSLELVPHAEDVEIQACLFSAALLQFASEAIEPARQFVLTTPLDPDVLDVRSNLLVASDLLAITFPEQDDWREARKGDQEFRRQWYAEHSTGFGFQDESFEDTSWEYEYLDDGFTDSSTTIHNEGAKVGRNDPCPCGSGKKYKKCCLNKTRIDPLLN